MRSTSPQAPKVPYQCQIGNKQVSDDYHWLQDIDNKTVTEYLESEAKYFREKMEETEQLQKKLFDEILGRIQETDESVPYRVKDYLYFEQTYEGLEYPVYLRQHHSKKQQEVLIDLNKLGENQDYIALGSMDISPDQRWLAYTLDNNGDEIYDLYIQDLGFQELDVLERDRENCSYNTPKLIVEGMSGDVCWDTDSDRLFYTLLDEQLRPYKVCYFEKVSEAIPETTSKPIYHEKDPQFYLGLSRNNTDEIVFISSESNDTTEIFAIDPEQLVAKPTLGRKKGIEYDIDYINDTYYISANDTCSNFRLYSSQNLNTNNKLELIPASKTLSVLDFEIMASGIAVILRRNGFLQLEFISHTGEKQRDIVFSTDAASIHLHDNFEYTNKSVRVETETFLSPSCIYDICWETGKKMLLKEDKVLGSFDASDYITRREYARSSDGELVPITIVAHKKTLQSKKKSPLLLYTYGAYGESLDPWFSHSRLSLLDRGVIFAVAHVRGGSDLGMDWYHAGKLLHKQNSMSDFIACSKHLINLGYTSPEKLAINGGSAGGLLIGSVLNSHPDLFHSAILDVPFLDCLNTMLDKSLPLTETEFDEWGDPQNEEFYKLIQSYSPYDNIAARDYPHILVMANLNDTRVQYWEAAKWVAKLRDKKTDTNNLLLHIDKDSGHGGASGRYGGIKEIALTYAFLLKTWGLMSKE